MEFVNFSAGFEIGFLVWVSNGKPTMERTSFSISADRILLEPKEYDPLRLPGAGERVSLVFANPMYTERCEMGIVRGAFLRRPGSLEIEPHEVIWALSFDVAHYPDRIVKRWKRA
jgi:hypothetical protein